MTARPTLRDQSDRLVDELLGPLHMHFLTARRAYRDYLDNGRTFLFASSLKRINLGARTLLVSKGHLLPHPQIEDAAALIAHYDVWLTLWEEHAERTRPSSGDSFVFANSFTYPRDAEQRLDRLYEELKSKR